MPESLVKNESKCVPGYAVIAVHGGPCDPLAVRPESPDRGRPSYATCRAGLILAPDRDSNAAFFGDLHRCMDAALGSDVTLCFERFIAERKWKGYHVADAV